jgi:hypothetical protein
MRQPHSLNAGSPTPTEGERTRITMKQRHRQPGVAVIWIQLV